MKKRIYLLILQLTSLFVLNSCIKKEELVLPANPQPVVQNLGNTNSFFVTSLQGYGGVPDKKVSVSDPIYVFNSADSTGTISVTEGANVYTFTLNLKEGNRVLQSATANYEGYSFTNAYGSFNITTPSSQISTVLTGTFSIMLSWTDGTTVKLINLSGGSFLAKI